MPRTLEITVPAARSDAVVADLRRVDGVIGVRLQRGISLEPPGDVITVELTTAGLHHAIRLLEARGIGREAGSSISTSEPMSLVSRPHAGPIARDTSEATWEEMQRSIAKESNMTVNGLAIMALAGVLAAVGLATNALHVVVGAMVIAPGFEPIVRIGLGAVAHGRALRRGVVDTLEAYAALIAGAVVATLVLRASGSSPLGGAGSSYLPSGVLLSYWTQVSATSVMVTLAGGIAGAVVIAANRSVLTAGVMVALALVPSAAMVGMGLATGTWDLALAGARRFGLELGLVLVSSVLVFAAKRATLQPRESLA